MAIKPPVSLSMEDDETQELLNKAAGLDVDQKQALVKKWRQAASGHRKNASYYARQLQPTRKKQEDVMAATYDKVASALEEIISQ